MCALFLYVVNLMLLIQPKCHPICSIIPVLYIPQTMNISKTFSLLFVSVVEPHCAVSFIGSFTQLSGMHMDCYCAPSKHGILTQCRLNAGPSSATMASIQPTLVEYLVLLSRYGTITHSKHQAQYSL